MNLTGAKKLDNSQRVKPFGLSDKVGYLLGDLGNDFSFIFASSYLIWFSYARASLAMAIAFCGFAGVKLVKLLSLCNFMGYFLFVCEPNDGLHDASHGEVGDECQP